jgi:colicin import membrane protein
MSLPQTNASLAGNGSAKPRSRPRPTTAKASPYGAPASLALHVLTVAALLFAFRNSLDSVETHMVPVELVIAETTNVAAAAPPAPPEEDKFERPPLEALPPPPEPDIAEPAPVEAKPPEIKITPPPREKPEPRNDINALLNQLTKPDRNAPRTAPRASEAVGASNMATASLADALRSQIRNCWSPMTGAPNPNDQVVTFSLRLSRDGRVAGLEVLSYTNNAYGAAAVETATRAIRACEPYRLPVERYSQWQEFRPLRFDPRQMMQ